MKKVLLLKFVRGWGVSGANFLLCLCFCRDQNVTTASLDVLRWGTCALSDSFFFLPLIIYLVKVYSWECGTRPSWTFLFLSQCRWISDFCALDIKLLLYVNAPLCDKTWKLHWLLFKCEHEIACKYNCGQFPRLKC